MNSHSQQLPNLNNWNQLQTLYANNVETDHTWLKAVCVKMNRPYKKKFLNLFLKPLELKFKVYN